MFSCNSGRRQELLLSSFLILSVQDFSGGANRIEKKRLPEKATVLDHIILQIEKKSARPSMEGFGIWKLFAII